MRIFVAGIDGYLGWSLAKHLMRRGHEVAGADGFLRRRWVAEMGSHSALPIASIEERLARFQARYGAAPGFTEGDLTDYDLVCGIVRRFQPDAVVHLAECPSAPYSMIDRDHAVFVQHNNLTTTFNLLFALREHRRSAHLLKLGTMGEYGTPDVDIPEGFFEIEYRGRRDRLPFPRQANSWYHWSKVHGSNNVMFACRTWGLRATDIMQGIVFGSRIDGDDAALPSRLDFDQAFGTIVNRFCCQAAIGHPLTLYGGGHQYRGFIPLRDAMQCFTLALENPPGEGEYRVLNQFADVFGLSELAERVKRAAEPLGLPVEIRHLENPRKEADRHYYNPDHGALFELGYRPTRDIQGELRALLEDVLPHRARIAEKREVLIPDIQWSGPRHKAHFV